MGAAASIRLLHKEAVSWFRNYIDAETYLKDFEQLDKDSDGSIGYGDLKKWIEMKLETEGGNWTVFKANIPVMMIAHKMASETNPGVQNAHGKVVDVSEFRSLLLNLFSISILWLHFDHANSWGEGHDVGSKMLDKEQFGVACRTLAATHAHENLTDEQIEEDFNTLDKNGTGSVGFMEVCRFCGQYLHGSTPTVTNFPNKFFGTQASTEVMNDLASGPKQYYDSASADEKMHRAVDALALKVEEANKVFADPAFIEPLKSQRAEMPSKAETKEDGEVRSLDVDVQDMAIADQENRSPQKPSLVALDVDSAVSPKLNSVSPRARISPSHMSINPNKALTPRASTPRNIEVTSSPRMSNSPRPPLSPKRTPMGQAPQGITTSYDSPRVVSITSPLKSSKVVRDFIPPSIEEGEHAEAVTELGQ